MAPSRHVPTAMVLCGTAAFGPRASSIQFFGGAADKTHVNCVPERAIRPQYRTLNMPFFGSYYEILRSNGLSWCYGLMRRRESLSLLLSIAWLSRCMTI